MWHDNAPSAYLVLALGNWLGGVTKGVTGFGSAILNLCCWIAFVVAGVDSGTLQQAVVTEALSSTLIAPGLLYVTRAHATADFRTTAAISLFVGLSSPVGAAALARWDAQLIELVMAAALLVIMLAEQLSSLARCWSTNANGDAAGAEGREGGLLSGDGSVTPQPLPRLQAVGAGRRFKGGAHEWLAVLGIGAVAGTASGIMEGLTGMNGPPIMICYRLLNTPKSTVRGNNAILNLLQMRLIPYYFMGLIRSVDLQLYVVACAAGVLGAVAGDLLSHNMQQKTFQALLGVLMVLCCFLMFASGLGYV
ncbi:hypothetical protein COO60DRAFT_1462905 [Scenedesmus sp. NREL 46B-D3]|nr:hypothetical protein COO60DRAFT_1462905 [Scenedesmus sp. NREL 46B-D3]